VLPAVTALAYQFAHIFIREKNGNVTVTLGLLQLGLPGNIGAMVVSFLITVATFIVSFVVIYLVAKSVLVRVTKRTLNQRDFSPAIVSLGSSIAGAVALFAAVAIAATVAGFPAILTAFATLAGALALGFSFAASDIVENFVAGVFILKDKPFEIGDYIEWSGNGGVVREINLRVSKLDTWDNEQLTVPNGDLANAVVKNTQANDTRRVTVDFGIEYDHDADRAREIILEEAGKIEGVLEDPAPSAPMTTLADSAVVLNARLWINPQETGAGGIKHKLTENVKNRFDEEGIGFPYNYTEITGSLNVNRTQADD
jgi:small-conductance mechanosensitive channel